MMMPRPVTPGTKPALPPRGTGTPSLPGFPGHGGHTIPRCPPINLDQIRDRFEFSQLDKDKDGVLSRNELPDSRTNVGRFAKYDKDQDGNIDAKEYSQARSWERFVDRIRDNVTPLAGGLTSSLSLSAGKFFGKADA